MLWVTAREKHFPRSLQQPTMEPGIKPSWSDDQSSKVTQRHTSGQFLFRKKKKGTRTPFGMISSSQQLCRYGFIYGTWTGWKLRTNFLGQDDRHLSIQHSLRSLPHTTHTRTTQKKTTTKKQTLSVTPPRLQELGAGLPLFQFNQFRQSFPN